MCHKKGLDFSEIAEYGIVQNTNDTFRGDKITILYDPGLFPALLTEGETVVKRNGGVPQEGDLNKHLQLFQKHLILQIPDKNFAGNYIPALMHI